MRNGEERAKRQPSGLALAAVAIVSGVAAFERHVAHLSLMASIVVVAAVLAVVAVIVGVTRQRYQTERGPSGPNPAADAVLGAFVAGMAAGGLLGWAWSGRWPDAPSTVMYLAMLGLGVAWLRPWLGLGQPPR